MGWRGVSDAWCFVVVCVEQPQATAEDEDLRVLRELERNMMAA
jgi:hypothetical protein